MEAKWTCQLAKLDSRGQPGEALSEEAPITVGERFHMACEGPAAPLDSQALSLELPPNAKYAIRILEARSIEDTRAEFIATTWVGSTVEFPKLILTDKKTSIDLGPLKIFAKSVIPAEAQQAEQPPEAKPPYAPVQLGLPGYVWIFVGLILVILALWGFWIARASMKRRRLKSLLEKNQIAMTPYNFFNKELRRLSRTGPHDTKEYVKELNESFRWYLTRELVVPAVDSGPSQIVREIRKKHPEVLKPVKRELTLALNELEKALSAKQVVGDEDVSQLTELCRTLADRIHAVRSA